MTYEPSDAVPAARNCERDDQGRSALEVRELRKTYAGGVEAVRGIDFEVRTGECSAYSDRTG
jgi:hypothetical protein